MAFEAREEAARRDAARQKADLKHDRHVARNDATAPAAETVKAETAVQPQKPAIGASVSRATPLAKKAPVVASPVPRTARRRMRGLVNVFAIVAAAGIVGTFAIPAYAMNPNTQGQGVFGASAADNLRHSDAQNVEFESAKAPKVQADTFKVTSAAELQQRNEVAAANQAQAQLAAYAAAYTGPSAADFLKNPPYPHFDLSKVFSVARKYQGVPYVYGGATPAGFDCSGFVMFVYSQFGISLPHSASAQGAIGTRIDPKDARPGDVIVLDDGSHDGFWAGPGMILDAPEPGRVVTTRPLWTTAYYVVRFGIGK